MTTRTHTCACGHSWTKEVELSDSTPNISGEKTPWCPVCGKRAAYSSPTAEEQSKGIAEYYDRCQREQLDCGD
jgi:hypothetical protein